MAVVHYHIHMARPSGFAQEGVEVIRLMLSAGDQDGVWLYRRGEWTEGRFNPVADRKPMWPK